MAPAISQTQSFPPLATRDSKLATSVSLHQIDEKFREADRSLEQSIRHLADAGEALAAVPDDLAAKIRHRVSIQTMGISTSRRNLVNLIMSRRVDQYLQTQLVLADQKSAKSPSPQTLSQNPRKSL